MDIKKQLNILIENAIGEAQVQKSTKSAKELYTKAKNKDGKIDPEVIEHQFEKDIKERFPALKNNKVGKFTLGTTRLFLNGEFYNHERIHNFNDVLYKISDLLYDKFDRNLNNLSYDQIIEKVNKVASKEEDDEDPDEIRFFNLREYRIYPIQDYQQAAQFRSFTTWCVCDKKKAYDEYTKNDLYKFYFCVSNDFLSIEKEPEEDAPLDEYGLSMIAILVNENGDLESCTTRWNHDNGSTGHDLNEHQIEILLGINDFHSVFKPSEKLKNSIQKISNFVKRTGTLSGIVSSFEDDEDYMLFQIHGKYNWINKNGEYLSPMWFDYAHKSDNGYACVSNDDGLKNIISLWNGKLLSPNRWFTDISTTFNKYGIATVQIGTKYNIINKEGKILLNQNVDSITNYSINYSVVTLGNKKNFITATGELVSPNQWFDAIGPYSDGFFKVKIDGKGWNYMNATGQILSPDMWFYSATNFDRSKGGIVGDAKGNYYQVSKTDEIRPIYGEVNPNLFNTTVPNNLRGLFGENKKNFYKNVIILEKKDIQKLFKMLKETKNK